MRVFGRWSTLLTLLFTIPLFVSENIRLYGWVLFFIKNGVLLGSMKSLFGIETESILFTLGAILLGMVYVYLPFMLFPMTLSVAMVPNDTREAAPDLGASRWQVFREVELPLSMPGIVIGFLLTFVLAVGAIAEAKSPRRPEASSRSRMTSRSPSPMRRTGRSGRHLPSCLCCWLACSSSLCCAASTSTQILGRRRAPLSAGASAMG